MPGALYSAKLRRRGPTTAPTWSASPPRARRRSSWSSPRKTHTRLDELIRGWRRAVPQRRVSLVLYLCSPKAIRPVKRSIARARAGDTSGPSR